MRKKLEKLDKKVEKLVENALYFLDYENKYNFKIEKKFEWIEKDINSDLRVSYTNFEFLNMLLKDHFDKHSLNHFIETNPSIETQMFVLKKFFEIRESIDKMLKLIYTTELKFLKEEILFSQT
ncbi:MAG: hypothetical protein ACRC0V_05975 [Fusobacteriaceae bacterium]